MIGHTGLSPSAWRNSAGIWIDRGDPAFTEVTQVLPDAPGDDPAIYLFSNSRDGDGIAYAMAEDGTVLGSHWCSHWRYMLHDLHDRPNRKARCEAHYPDGYRVVVLGPGEAPPPEVLGRNAAYRTDAMTSQVER